MPKPRPWTREEVARLRRWWRFWPRSRTLSDFCAMAGPRLRRTPSAVRDKLGYIGLARSASERALLREERL